MIQTGEPLRAGLQRIRDGFWDYRKESPDGLWAFRDFVVATDGYLLVAVPRDVVPGDCAECPSKVAELAAAVLAFKPVDPTVTPVERLREFAGPLPDTCATCGGQGTIDCKECDGIGEVSCQCDDCGDEHDKECPKCHGDGSRKCRDCQSEQHRPATLLTRTVNRDKLAEMFAALQPTGDVSISIERIGKAGEVYCFIGDGWRGVLVPMSPHVKPQAEYVGVARQQGEALSVPTPQA